MEGSIDMEQKGCESKGCYTHFVTFNFDLINDLNFGFLRSNFEKLHYSGMGWPIDMEKEGMWVDRMLDPCCSFQHSFTSPMTLTLTLHFQGQILKKSYLRNGMANWQGTKGMWVDRMLDPCCDFQRSPQPWPWPCIFKVKFLNSYILEWEGSSTSNERDRNR